MLTMFRSMDLESCRRFFKKMEYWMAPCCFKLIALKYSGASEASRQLSVETSNTTMPPTLTTQASVH